MHVLERAVRVLWAALTCELGRLPCELGKLPGALGKTACVRAEQQRIETNKLPPTTKTTRNSADDNKQRQQHSPVFCKEQQRLVRQI